MHVTPSLVVSISKRLIPSVYGISRKGVHVQSNLQIERISTGVVQVGEDAAFISVGNSSRYHVFGVADGVGGWNKEGVDPSFFSKVLMESCCRVSVRETVDLSNPVQILSSALKEVTCFHSRCYGSSTACVLSLDCSTGVLHTANLGDSGYLVVRDGSVIAESQTLIHYFNCPYQLSNPPPGFNSSQIDKPCSANSFSLKLEAGDFIVAATDGLFNNMYTNNITDFFRDFRFTEQADLDNMVQEMVKTTYRLSLDNTYLSPFAESGSQALSWEYQGGKPDDITIMLAAVTDAEEQQPSSSQPSR